MNSKELFSPTCLEIGCRQMFLAVSLLLLSQVVSPAQAPPDTEPPLRQFHQDFRTSQSLHPALALEGPADVVDLTKFEAEGFRVTLPAGRQRNNPAEIVTSFVISGDFEITGTYELLSAARPTKGYGVGVTLNIADTKARKKFAKMARVLLPRKGSVFQSQYWVHKPRHDYKEQTKPTLSRIGQLRIVRKGAALRCLAADGLEGKFQEFLSIKEFGREDMGHVLLGVTDSGSPGFAVDARLLDFDIRAAKFVPDPGSDLGSALPPLAQPQPKAGSKKWLAALAIMGLLLLSLLAVFLLARRRRSSNSLSPGSVSEGEVGAETTAPPISLRCSGCAKTMKVKAELSGKKIKCPQCGKVVVVSEIDDVESDRHSIQ